MPVVQFAYQPKNCEGTLFGLLFFRTSRDWPALFRPEHFNVLWPSNTERRQLQTFKVYLSKFTFIYILVSHVSLIFYRTTVRICQDCSLV
jgi:hypothetical protein